jgi:hypothetical protein
MHLDAAGMCKFGNSYNLVLWEYGPIKSVFQGNYFGRGTDKRFSPSKLLVIGKSAQQMRISGDNDVILNVGESEVVL